MERTTTMPADRGDLPTERRLEASCDLDAGDVEATLSLINNQDATVAAVVREAVPEIAGLTRRVIAALADGGRMIYFGAGTSGRLGVLDASECPPTFQSDPGQVVGLIAGGDTALRCSSEGAEDDPEGARVAFEDLAVGSSDLVLGIAAGGTTPYVIGGIEQAARCGATTALLSCDRPVGLRGPRAWRFASRPPDMWVSLALGPEVLTGSTRMKAGTATKMVLNMVSTTAFAQLGKTWGNLMVDVRATNAKLRDRAIRILLETCPGLTGSRPRAEGLLDAAGGRVKVAIVMAVRGLDQAAAEAFLQRHAGRLRAALGDPGCADQSA